MLSIMSTVAIMTCLLTITSALPKSVQNWETATNELGYTTFRFEAGFEPGSDDYYHRTGGLGTNSSGLSARQETRTTSPYMGDTRIAYGCNTNIGDYVFTHLFDMCDDDRCDAEKDATVTLSIEGQYPHGERDHMIKAIQAMVPANGVDYYNVTSTGPLINQIYETFRCEVVGASNFFSVVVRNDEDDSLVAIMDVHVTFEMGENAAICGTMAKVAKEIAGAISAIAGALFGVVQAVACKI